MTEHGNTALRDAALETIRAWHEASDLSDILPAVLALKKPAGWCDTCHGRGYLVGDADWEPYAVKCEACSAVNERTSLHNELSALRAALELFRSFGCPLCQGDCASANPQPVACPMIIARTALTASRERK